MLMSGTQKYLFSALLVLLSVVVGQAQDIHFSQFFNSPVNLNPAETGNFKGDLRFVGNHKQQWNSFENAYTTFSASLDKAFLLRSDLKPAIGFLINNDVAGDGDFGTMRLELPLSLVYSRQKSNFSFGISPAFVQHGLNFNALYFGSQYNGDQFDPDLPGNEIPDVNRFSYFDMSAGIFYRYQMSDSSMFKAGLSANHLFSPVKSFYSNPDVNLNLRWQVYAGAEIPVGKDITAEPAILYMLQGTYREFDIGTTVRFDFNPLGLRSVYAGMFMRARDAGILMFGMDYNGVLFQLSYDVNLSGLRTISRGRGGVELSLVYVFSKTRLIPAKLVRKCPDFM